MSEPAASAAAELDAAAPLAAGVLGDDAFAPALEADFRGERVVADFVAVDFCVTDFCAAVFVVADLCAAAFLGAGFLAAVSVAPADDAAVFVVLAFFPAVLADPAFFVAAFFVVVAPFMAAIFVAVFLVAVFLVAIFLVAVSFVAVSFVAVSFGAVLFEAAFLMATLPVATLPVATLPVDAFVAPAFFVAARPATAFFVAAGVCVAAASGSTSKPGITYPGSSRGLRPESTPMAATPDPVTVRIADDEKTWDRSSSTSADSLVSAVRARSSSAIGATMVRVIALSTSLRMSATRLSRLAAAAARSSSASAWICSGTAPVAMVAGRERTALAASIAFARDSSVSPEASWMYPRSDSNAMMSSVVVVFSPTLLRPSSGGPS